MAARHLGLIVLLIALLEVSSAVTAECSNKQCGDSLTDLVSNLSAILPSPGSLAELSAVKTSLVTLSAVLMATLPEDCSAAMRRGSRSIYQLIAPPGLCPRMVRCDMTTSGGGWTVALWRSPRLPPHQLRDNNPLLRRFCDATLGMEEENNQEQQIPTLFSDFNKHAEGRARENEISNMDLPHIYKAKGGRNIRTGGRPEHSNELRENFNRTWSEYKRGFGHYQSEYWIGNAMLHSLTTSTDEPWEALILLADHGGQVAEASYAQFRVHGEETNYKLSVSGFGNGGKSSSAGDALSFHHDRAFSTYDRDNDQYHGSHCGAEYGAGWWFHQCHVSLLTGAPGGRSQIGHNLLHWSKWRGLESLHSAAILIRPKNAQ